MKMEVLYCQNGDTSSIEKLYSGDSSKINNINITMDQLESYEMFIVKVKEDFKKVRVCMRQDNIPTRPEFALRKYYLVPNDMDQKDINIGPQTV
ncbi:hypothetical protein [Lysinibacillus sp. NPDC092081]|uniref:hypothetical protein n=1 Tax=Lysinibacillus sp. NPDC092081 TaxID=3364131 RepID=UPI0038081199